MTANELYALLDANGIDYELIAEFEGLVRLNIIWWPHAAVPKRVYDEGEEA
jgi:hypothetical protein